MVLVIYSLISCELWVLITVDSIWKKNVDLIDVISKLKTGLSIG